MASVYDIKPQFQALLRPLTNRLAKSGGTANMVTIAAVIVSIATGVAIYCFREHPKILFILPIALFIRMALNAIDGMLAREHDMKSKLGAILNELGDVISDAAIYLPLAVIPGFCSISIIAIVILSIIVEMTGVVAVQIGASRRYDGPMGKSDRAFVLGTLGLLIAIGITPGRWLDIVLCIVTALLLYTIVNRSRKALREQT